MFIAGISKLPAILRKTLSKYKFKRLATESFRNALRLHSDSILLYHNESFPSAFQLSVLALEEFSKAEWVHHYYYSSITNEGFAEQEFEQEWLKLLFIHPKKQFAFFGREIFDYSSKFIEFVQTSQLEYKKQKATYVGLIKRGKVVDVNGRISLPSQIQRTDAKQIISLINEYLKEKCEMKFYYEDHFYFDEMDELLSGELYGQLSLWRHRSGLRKRGQFKTVLKNGAKNNDRWKEHTQKILKYINEITKTAGNNC